jgi:hypothetical protein
MLTVVAVAVTDPGNACGRHESGRPGLERIESKLTEHPLGDIVEATL